MKRTIILGGLTAAMMAGTPVYAQSAGHILRGAGIGAAGGAVVGALVPGLSVGTGALIGAAGGATLNALDKGHHHHYRHRHYYRHGRRYYR